MNDFLAKLKSYKIKKIINNSDDTTERLRITFDNGYGISIIKGENTYGGKQGLFEIAPLNLNDDLDGSLLGIKDDDVEGWLTQEEVVYKMEIIALF